MTKKTLCYGGTTIELPDDIDMKSIRQNSASILAGDIANPLLHIDAPGDDQWILIAPGIPTRLVEREVHKSSGRKATVL